MPPGSRTVNTEPLPGSLATVMPRPRRNKAGGRLRTPESDNGSHRTLGPLLLRLDVGGPDHLAPLLGFVDDELAEIGR